MNEKYKLNKEWLDLLLEHKNNENVTFNLSNNDIRILLTYIEVLQNRIDKVVEYLYKHSQYNDGDGVHYIKEDEYCVDYLLDILKEVE